MVHLYTSYFVCIFLLALPSEANHKLIQKSYIHFCASYRYSEDYDVVLQRYVYGLGHGRGCGFLSMPTTEHCTTWAEYRHSVKAFWQRFQLHSSSGALSRGCMHLHWLYAREAGTAGFQCSTKQYLAFFTHGKYILFFFSCINRNIIFVISKKFTRFENYFCKNLLSASLQECSKS